MTFVFYLTLAFAYLLTVAFVFSGLFAMWDESAKHKAAQRKLDQILAARKLARYWHWTGCNCHWIQGAVVHIDPRCLQWTSVQRRRLELRREAKKEPGATRARISHHN